MWRATKGLALRIAVEILKFKEIHAGDFSRPVSLMKAFRESIASISSEMTSSVSGEGFIFVVVKHLCYDADSSIMITMGHEILMNTVLIGAPSHHGCSC